MPDLKMGGCGFYVMGNGKIKKTMSLICLPQKKCFFLENLREKAFYEITD